MRGDTHLALVCLLEPLAESDEAALLQRGQIPQVSLNVVSIKFICNVSYMA
jgi:hypothetical protein